MKARRSTNEAHRNRPGRPGPLSAVFAALLDRSFAQIAEACADGRRFDRETLATVSDVWDNNTFPFVRVASTRGRRRRERRAQAALNWMSESGADRRAWMVTQAALAGYAMEEVLPSAAPLRPYRDYRGLVCPIREELTPQCVEELSRAYDLSAARVLDIRVEWAAGVLVGALRLSAACRYLGEDAAGRDTVTLSLLLGEVSEARYDSADAHGAAISVDPYAVTVEIGVGGRIRAQTASVHLQDFNWHLSPAGRRADAATPVESHPSTRSSGGAARPPRGHSGAVALLLHRGMLDVRMARYGRHAADLAIADVLRTFDGAADAILAAGAHRWPGRRHTAFRKLAETWIRRAGPQLLRSFAAALAENGPVHLLNVIRETQKERKARRATVVSPTGPLPVPRPDRKRMAAGRLPRSSNSSAIRRRSSRTAECCGATPMSCWPCHNAPRTNRMRRGGCASSNSMRRSAVVCEPRRSRPNTTYQVQSSRRSAGDSSWATAPSRSTGSKQPAPPDARTLTGGSQDLSDANEVDRTDRL